MAVFRPGKPRCKARLAADVTLAAGLQTVPLNELVWSEPTDAWTGGPGLRCTRAGYYLIVATVSRAALAAGSQLQVRCALNGVQPAESPTIITPSTTAVITHQMTDVIAAQEGDIVTMLASLNGAGTATCRRIGTYLSIMRVAPVAWT